MKKQSYSVEQPTKFELVINLKTAKQIGLVIPPNVLARADRVIRKAHKRSQKVKALGTVLVCMMLSVFLPSSSAAQEGRKVLRLGFLHSGAKSDLEALQRELRTGGYVEGKNIIFEYGDVEGKPERFPEIAAELTRRSVDIIVAVNEAAARAAKTATRTIPIVMIRVGPNPVEAGLVDSFAQPGGNLTGITLMAVEITGKRLELFKEAVPQLSRVDALADPAVRGNVQEARDIEITGPSFGLSSKTLEIRGADDIHKVFAALGKERGIGLYVPGGPTTTPNMRLIADLAARNKIPSIYTARRYVELGGLISYGYDQLEHYQRAAWYIDKILKGAKPANLPVERPTKFEMAINLKTAKQIGLTIPPNVLARADRVIK